MDDGNIRMYCYIYIRTNNIGINFLKIMKYAEVSLKKRVQLIYSEKEMGKITIIQGNKVVDVFNTCNLSIDEFLNIEKAVKKIVDKWYLHGAALRRRLEEVRYLPIY
jgi:hypothetical protein